MTPAKREAINPIVLTVSMCAAGRRRIETDCAAISIIIMLSESLKYLPLETFSTTAEAPKATFERTA